MEVVPDSIDEEEKELSVERVNRIDIPHESDIVRNDLDADEVEDEIVDNGDLASPLPLVGGSFSQRLILENPSTGISESDKKIAATEVNSVMPTPISKVPALALNSADDTSNANTNKDGIAATTSSEYEQVPVVKSRLPSAFELRMLVMGERFRRLQAEAERLGTDSTHNSPRPGFLDFNAPQTTGVLGSFSPVPISSQQPAKVLRDGPGCVHWC